MSATGCQCGAKKYTDDVCEYCGNRRAEEKELSPMVRVKSNRGTFKRLQDTILIGDWNTIHSADNCEIIGNRNTVKYSKNVTSKGNWNRIG